MYFVTVSILCRTMFYIGAFTRELGNIIRNKYIKKALWECTIETRTELFVFDDLITSFCRFFIWFRYREKKVSVSQDTPCC